MVRIVIDSNGTEIVVYRWNAWEWMQRRSGMKTGVARTLNLFMYYQ